MATATISKARRRMRGKQETANSNVAQQKPDWLQTWLPRLLVPLGSSLLLWLCFFPVAWGFLAWGALLPLLCLVRGQASGKRVFLLSYLAGLAFFLPILQWMRVADSRMFLAWLFLGIYCALYFPVAMVLIRRMDRTGVFPLWLSVPVAWVGMEYVRAWMISGFAWYYLGHTQHDFLQLIQIADLGGVYLVSFLVAAVNGWLFECLYRWPAFRQMFRQQEPPPTPRWEHANWKPLALGALLLFLAFPATMYYGGERLSENRFMAGPRICLLQGNVDQRIRDAAAHPTEGGQALLSIEEHYRRLFPLAYDYKREQRLRMPDLVIWPETSFPGFYAENDMRFPVSKMPPAYTAAVNLMQELIAGLIAQPRPPVFDPRTGRKVAAAMWTCPTNHLLGLSGALLDDDAQEVLYNLAVLIDKKGDKLGRYEKIHRVPFGEFVPFREALPFMNLLSPYGPEWPGIAAGEKLTRLTLLAPSAASGEDVAWRMGVLICYEDTDPTLARNYGRDHPDGPPVDFLVNMSNDGWFDGTAEHEEHLAISRFRAIESRRAVVRSVNMGISGVIDSNGRVRKPTEIPHSIRDENGKPVTGKIWVVPEDSRNPDLHLADWSAFKKVDGVIHATVPIDSRTSFYAEYGDWVPGLCWIILGALAIWSISRGMRGPAEQLGTSHGTV